MNSSGASRGYSLRLADGSGWHIEADPGASSFVTKIASIFSLHHDNGHLTNYIFEKGSPGPSSPISLSDITLPATGWSSQKIRSIELWTHEDVPDIVCRILDSNTPELEILNVSYAMYPIYKSVIDKGGAPFHCALVERDGIGIVLPATGNTGKSTCCRRIPPPWKAMCDDEALAVKTGDGAYEVHPFPTWSNFIFDRPQRAWDVQSHAKLGGIFFIEQADVDEAIPLGQGEAAMRIYGASLQVMGRTIHSFDTQAQTSLKKLLFANACEITKAIPSYRLKVYLEGNFWEEIERVTDGLKK